MNIINHVDIQCSDFAASKAFYDAVLAPLGGARIIDMGHAVAYGLTEPYPEPVFWISQQADGDGFRQTHIAFTARDHDAVDAFFEAAKATGAEVLHAPRQWPEYIEAPLTDYYAAFVRDPDGNNIEATAMLFDV